MAEGIPFAEANTVLTAPTREDAAAGTVYDLHVHRYRDLDGRPNVISKWQLSAEELAEVNRTGGVIWFSCWGETHPPMWLSGHDPFVREDVKTLPRRLDIDDADFDIELARRVTVSLNGVEQRWVIAFDADQGFVKRKRLDERGQPLDPIGSSGWIEVETVHGDVEVRWLSAPAPLSKV